ncbi:O-antigen ligase family protein [Lentzea flava]|uniref:O-antigen polymerase n=1 Tax=Lentzea flava TaxID=103732 RepID=A0ABQ2V651_9PSEU|nr:O-antigen ligase family protein [Lentzea flava]MCP2203429.1 O-antigen ligase [Lentzea flava]GGU67965.1 O-antigen polymerase [Lentzea flava]
MTWLLRVLACATVLLAPLEGYLQEVHPHLAKVAPGLLIVSWAVQRVRERRLPAAHPLHAVLAVFAVVLLASAAVHAGDPFTLDYAQRFLPFLVITAVLVDVVVREVPVRAVLAAAVGGAVFAAVGALYSLVFEGAPRATGPLEDPNDLAFFLVAALPLLIALPFRKFLLPVGAVLAAGAAATFSRGGGLALAVAAVWLVARRGVSMRAVGATVGGLAVIGLGAAVFAGPVLDRALAEKKYIAATNVDTRELRWQAAARMLADNPVLGVGPGGFRSSYAAASRNAEIDEQSPVAHNIYLEIGAELGLPGLACFLGAIALAFVSAERALRAGAVRSMLAVQASLIAALVASTFLSEQYYLPIWSLVAVAIAADLRREERERDACVARHQ